MSEEPDVCTECDGGYLQVSVDTRKPCPFCEGTGTQSRQLYTILAGEANIFSEDRERHLNALMEKKRWDRILNRP